MIDRSLRLTLHRHDQEEQAEQFSAYRGIARAVGAGLGVWAVIGGLILGIYYGLPILVRMVA